MKKEKLEELIKEISEKTFNKLYATCPYCFGLVDKIKAVRKKIMSRVFYLNYYYEYYCKDCAEELAKKSNYRIVYCPDCDGTYLVKKEAKK